MTACNIENIMVIVRIIIQHLQINQILVGSPCGVVANVLDFDRYHCEFKFHSCCYVHFWINTLADDETPYPSTCG